MNWSQFFFSFKGRISRQHWWLGHLGLIVLLLLAMAATGMLDNNRQPPDAVFIVVGLLYLPWIWCSFALSAKRWHDRDKSAWWILIGLIPIVGIWALIENGFLRGTDGNNSYGPNPIGE